MKQLKLYFKLLVMLIAINLLSVSCQKDDDQILNESKTSDQTVKIETVTRTFIEQHTGVREKLESLKIKAALKTNNELQRNVYNEHFDFIVDTEEAIYIENGDSHSFVFTMSSSNIDENILENLVLVLKTDGTYQASIYQYNLVNYNFESHIENDNISGFTKIILPDDLEFTSNVLNRSGGPCTRNYYQSATYSGYLTEDDCNSLPADAEPCEYSHQVINYNSDCDENVPHYSEGDGGGGNVYIEVIYVLNPNTGQYEVWYPDNSTGTGSGSYYNNNGDSAVFTYASLPYIDHSKHVAKSLGIAPLGPNAQTELHNWIINPDNIGIIVEIFSFIIENNYSDSAIEEAKMRIELEFVNDPTDPKWNTSDTGTFSGIQALQYDATYTLPGYSGQRKMFRLINPNRPEFNHKQVLFKSNTAHNINGQYNQTIASSEIPLDGNYHYLYNVDTERWYEYGLPIVSVDCLSCDLNNFFKSIIENSLVVAGRYFLPVEDMIILISGKDFYGAEQSRAVAGGFLLLEIVPGAKAIRLLKGVKHADEIVQLAEVTYKFVDEFYSSQKQTVKEVLEGVIDLDAFGNTIRKGNFGEMLVDTDLFSKGYEPLHLRRTNIDEPLSSGIDGVFKNPQTGEYVIVESKYNTSHLNPFTNDGPQMSDSWIQGTNTGFDRLQNEVGTELANEIYSEGYTRVLANIKPDGTIIYKQLNSNGQYMTLGKWVNDWTP